MRLHKLAGSAVSPGLAFMKLVLEHIEDFLDPPAQQIEQSDESGRQIHRGGQETVGFSRFRIAVNDPASRGAVRVFETDELAGDHAYIDRIIAVEIDRFVVIDIEALFFGDNHEHPELVGVVEVRPEDGVDKRRIEQHQDLLKRMAAALFLKKIWEMIAQNREFVSVFTVALDRSQRENQAVAHV